MVWHMGRTGYMPEPLCTSPDGSPPGRLARACISLHSGRLQDMPAWRSGCTSAAHRKRSCWDIRPLPNPHPNWEQTEASDSVALFPFSLRKADRRSRIRRERHNRSSAESSLSAGLHPCIHRPCSASFLDTPNLGRFRHSANTCSPVQVH